MKRFRNLFGPPGEKGSITPIVALGLLAFIGFMALSIDLGQLYVVRNELQNVADGAALAAAKQLIREDPANPGKAKIYYDDAVNAAIDCAKKNYSMGADGGINIASSDVVAGKWNLQAKQFDSIAAAGETDPTKMDAVQVTVRRAGGADGNSKVTTFFGNALGLSSQRDAEATAVAYMGPAGTSAPDIPFMVPPEYTDGQGQAHNGWHNLLDRFGPPPAYADATKTYRFYDKADGGTSSHPDLVTDRASWTVAKDTEYAGAAAYYAMKSYLIGTSRFPQKQVNDKLYPATEHIYGQYLKDYFEWMRTRWLANKNSSTGKWRVTVPVYSPPPVTASRPQNSWLKLASRLIPGVSQAHACTLISTPVVYVQGFATIDITNVYVKSYCNEANNGYTQKTDPNSCRNTCYMDIEVPLDQNTVSTDKGSNPTPYSKNYQDMYSNANPVGVFSAVPRLVK